ncbi:electron transport protein SCO1/SenC [Nitritalea halalkaliphila LW7]|uniref:Electron transport protein SCO1/SenC n=1 Tax=Nitritalea halalkaliphila LW7 TaxID=1189621 RepID=I5C4D5_9BACT|nr:SCO family protein [Nitritalea halalkaliphila]EIM76687.1 electron transport protein SCO1/SenC [Nitritalea halalkaliphila LW7]
MKKQAKIMYPFFLGILFLGLVACGGEAQKESKKEEGELPFLGQKTIDTFEMEGKTVTDTAYHKIADFSFLNQAGERVDNFTVDGKVYVADFFFTSCPTICPIMKTQMLRVYEAFGDEPDFKILSHSIDPEHDTVELLAQFASDLGVEDTRTWHFLTGDQEKIFEIGQTSYLTTAMEDKDEPGGYLHSGAFVLIDQNGHIRGIYDGTREDQVDRLLKDIPKLLKKEGDHA